MWPKKRWSLKTWPGNRTWRVIPYCGRKSTRKLSKPLILASWNVRTLIDRHDHDRPHRRTALIASELRRYNIDIAALSETRNSEEGSLAEAGEGYTFFWKGLPEGVTRIHGVGLAIRSSLLRNLSSMPSGINERLMTFRIPLTNKMCATIISAYAPTLDSADETKDAFYETLDSTLRRVPRADKIILLGDFNARVGSSANIWPKVLGSHGVGKMNANGLRLLSLCAEHNLVITNTIFQQPDKYKCSWKHPRSKSWHLLDYVIVRQRDLKDVLHTRAMRGAECWTDHRMIRTRARLQIRPPVRKCKASPKLNVASLNALTKQAELQENFAAASLTLPTPEECQHNEEINPDHDAEQPLLEQNELNALWESAISTIHHVAESTLGKTQRKNPDWFDESAEIIQPLLKAKNHAHNIHLANPRSRTLAQNWRNLRAAAQRKLREVQNDWWLRKSAEIQRLADENKTYKFYDAVKRIFGPSHCPIAPVRSADGAALIKEKSKILERWAEHFQELLNRTNLHDQSALDELPTLPTAQEIDAEPSQAEVTKALHSLKNKKSPGEDGVPGEVFKYGGPQLGSYMHSFLVLCWRNRKIPERWKNANIISIYKRKGDRSECGNSRGISLLDVAGKVLARIILHRLLVHISERILPESQCGFRPDRSTTDMIFAARLLLEKSREQQREINFGFIDLTKAFDTVNREILWKLLEKFGCPPTALAIIREFHNGMLARVSLGGASSEQFSVQSGVKQGCVLAPVLFNIYLVAVTLLSRTQVGPDNGISIRYRFDGGIFNTRRLKAKNLTVSTQIFELQYADDATAIAHDSASLQRSLTAMHEAYTRLGLVINTRKTEVMQTSFINNLPTAQLHIDGTPLSNVDSFTYLGSVISCDGTADNDILRRINLAASSFGRLRERVFLNGNLKLVTKISVYRAVVISTLLYGSETWTLYRHQMRKLESFHIRCLQRILHITWKDKIPHTEILSQAGITSIEAIVHQRLLRWVGHVVRMPENRLPKRILFGELTTGTRPRGRPKKRFRDHLKCVLSSCRINPAQLEDLALNRQAWRSLCDAGIAQFEQTRRENLEEKRYQRHLRLSSNLPGNFPCHLCPKTCHSRIGLHSHLAAHGRQDEAHRRQRRRQY